MEKKVLVFLPTYNECRNLPLLLERLFALGLDLSILIVDDRSPDGTGAVAEELALLYPGRVRVIHRDGPRGRGKAGILGLREAARMSVDYVVEMDADLSHDPAELPMLLAAARDADVVIGSRYINGGKVESFGLVRELNSGTARLLTRLILGLNYSDTTSGYRVYRRDLLARLNWDCMISEGPSVVEETLFHLQQIRARVREVKITYQQRGSGQSKITPTIILRWIVDLLRIRLNGSRHAHHYRHAHR